MTPQQYAKYCQNAAANVLNKDGHVRFTLEQLNRAMDQCSQHADNIEQPVLELHNNILKLCELQNMDVSAEYTLLITLITIHMSYIWITGV